MKDNQEMLEINENESSTGNEEYAPKKSRTVNFLIILGCLLAAFIFWCIAHYAADPMVERTRSVEFVLVGGSDEEQIVYEPITLVFYGKQSYLDSHSVIEIEIDRNAFNEYDVDTLFSIKKTDNYHTHSKEVVLKLVKTQTVPND